MLCPYATLLIENISILLHQISTIRIQKFANSKAFNNKIIQILTSVS